MPIRDWSLRGTYHVAGGEIVGRQGTLGRRGVKLDTLASSFQYTLSFRQLSYRIGHEN